MARGLAAAAVVWWHVAGSELNSPRRAMWTVSGRLAVWLFFILSGYLIGSGFADRRYTWNWASLGRFYRNRWLRIFPLYLFVGVVSFGIHQILGDLHLSVWELVRELLMLKLRHDYQLNGVFWTLGIEVQFYLVAPILIFLQLYSPRPMVTAVIVYIALIYLVKLDGFIYTDGGDARTLIGNLVHFQTGILICLCRPLILKMKSTPAVIGTVTLLALAALLICNRLYFFNNHAFLHTNGILLADAMGALVLIAHILLERRKIRRGWLTTAGLILGVLSYGLYAWHSVVQMVPAFSLGFLFVFGLSMICAYLSYRLIEQPALLLKKLGRREK